MGPFPTRRRAELEDAVNEGASGVVFEDFHEPIAWSDDYSAVVTQRSDAHCTVKKTSGDLVYLMYEMRGFPALPGVAIGIDLKPGVTYAEAKQLACLINLLSPGLFSTVSRTYPVCIS